MSTDEAIQAALKEVLSDSGSGASVDDPRRLGRIHPLLAPSLEFVLISGVYGGKDKDWFDAGRRYHKDNSVCEQLIRVGRIPKPDWAQPDHIYSMFFEISALSDSAPVPDELRKASTEAALKMPVPDASFASRFPLTAIKAHDAKEAARTIAGYLAQAQAVGWRVGSARALMEEWRNEYDLTKGDEKTTFRFDMRPMLTSPSRLDLVALTLIAGTPKLEEVIQNFESMDSWPEAFARAGLSFVDTSTSEQKASTFVPMPNTAEAPYLAIRGGEILLNTDALKKYQHHTVSVVGKGSTVEMTWYDLAMILAFAKNAGWSGHNVFETSPNGNYVLRVNDHYDLDDANGVGLSTVLVKVCTSLRGADQALVRTTQGMALIETGNSLATIASRGALSVRFSHSKHQSSLPHTESPEAASPTFNTSVRSLQDISPEGSATQKVGPIARRVGQRQWVYYVRRKLRGPVSQATLISLVEKGVLNWKTVVRPTDSEMQEGGYALDHAINSFFDLPDAEKRRLWDRARFGRSRWWKLKAFFLAGVILGSMPITAAIVYYLTHSVMLAIIGFFVPRVLWWLRGLWVIADAQRVLAESKSKLPDIERQQQTIKEANR
jgi:hypothetical protein